MHTYTHTHRQRGGGSENERIRVQANRNQCPVKVTSIQSIRNVEFVFICLKAIFFSFLFFLGWQPLKKTAEIFGSLKIKQFETTTDSELNSQQLNSVQQRRAPEKNDRLTGTGNLHWQRRVEINVAHQNRSWERVMEQLIRIWKGGAETRRQWPAADDLREQHAGWCTGNWFLLHKSTSTSSMCRDKHHLLLWGGRRWTKRSKNTLERLRSAEVSGTSAFTEILRVL